MFWFVKSFMPSPKKIGQVFKPFRKDFVIYPNGSHFILAILLLILQSDSQIIFIDSIRMETILDIMLSSDFIVSNTKLSFRFSISSISYAF